MSDVARPQRSGDGLAGPLRLDPNLGPGSALVPARSISGRALLTVVAIMTFLAAMAAGLVTLVASAADDWNATIAREITIQIRPAQGRPIEPDVERAAAIARSQPGVAQARAFTKQESERLLEPWLGAGLNLDELPVPRVIIVTLQPGARVDLQGLRLALQAAMPGTSVDDRRQLLDRLDAMANTVVLAGIAVVILVLSATALAVSFATTAAVSGNRDVVEVLHFVGAKDRYIERAFARHFLALGIKGGLGGAIAAIATLAFAAFVTGQARSTASGDQLEAMFGSFSVGLPGYAAILAIALVIALLTAIVSQRTVGRHLRRL